MDMHPRGQACWHPPQPQHDFLSGSKFIFVENREKKVEGSAWSLCSGRPLSTAINAVRLEDRKTHKRRAAESPCGRAQARQPRTAFSSLLPTFYFGSPLQSDHALPSPPYSLLNHNYRFIVGFRVDIEGCDLSVLPGCIHREASPCPEAVELSILPGLWECRQQMYDTCV